MKEPSQKASKIKWTEIYRQTFDLLTTSPTIGFLFMLLALFDLAVLFILFLAPSAPVSYLLAPIIRTFWSEQFLHYPQNFLLLPKLFNHAHFLIASVFGVVITGIVVKKIEAYTKGKDVAALSAAGSVLSRYFSLLVAWLISYGAFILGLKHLMPLVPGGLKMQLTGGFVLGVILQSLFTFLIPAVLIKGKGLFHDLWQGLRFGVKNIGTTSALICVPMLLMTVFSYFKAMTPHYVRVQPEMVLIVLSVGIIVSMLVDLFVTLSTTLFYVIEGKGKEDAV